MDFSADSDAPQVNSLVDHLFEQVRREHDKEIRASAKWKQHIRCLVLNLFAVRHVHTGRYIAISQNRNEYSKKSRYLANCRSHSITAHLILYLTENLGYISIHPGWQDKKTGKSYLTRVRAKKSLVSMFDQYEIDIHMLKRSGGIESIRLKDEQKNLIDYQDTLSTIVNRTSVETLNRRLSQTFIGMHLPDCAYSEMNEKLVEEDRTRWNDDDRIQPIDLSRKALYRVFNDNDFEVGGRFYGGWWQSVPGGLRKHIYICPPYSTYPKYTVEIDYSSMQTCIAYACCNIQPPNDAYVVEGYDQSALKRMRPFLKAGMLRVLNAKSDHEAIASLENAFAEKLMPTELPTAESVVRCLEDTHRVIYKQFFYKAKGKSLMWVESKIAEHVMLSMCRQRAAVLPIHDSFIVMKSYRDYLGRAMDQAFKAVTGFSCDMTYDQTEYEYEMEQEGGTFTRAEIDASFEYLDRDYELHAGFWKQFYSWLHGQD